MQSIIVFVLRAVALGTSSLINGTKNEYVLDLEFVAHYFGEGLKQLRAGWPEWPNSYNASVRSIRRRHRHIHGSGNPAQLVPISQLLTHSVAHSLKKYCRQRIKTMTEQLRVKNPRILNYYNQRLGVDALKLRVRTAPFWTNTKIPKEKITIWPSLAHSPT